MGVFIDGVWHDQWYDTKKSRGAFEREPTRFRNWVTSDGSAGPSGKGGFLAEGGRYHLYVCLACPWAHRTLIFRKLKKLDDLITVSTVSPLMGSVGWTFNEEEGSSGDPVNGAKTLGEIYLKADPKYSGRVTVPVLWDRKTGTIVSNESPEIIRMFNSAFNGLTRDKTDYYPEKLRPQIDRINELVYANINNGVYRAGFATTQEAYEEAFDKLFHALDSVEAILAGHRYLAGSAITEADWRLFTTLIRFDAVYVGHFKCNRKRIADYPNLSNYVRELYQVPGIAGTVDMHQIKTHYYASHKTINPTGIVPKGPDLDFSAEHDRGRFA